MNRFVQLHLLTSYPPSNLNRDDLGRPKTATMGGAQRLRVSSQSLKRAWRTSEVFGEALKGHLGTRTKALGTKVYADLIARGAKAADALEWAKAIAGVFGKLKDVNKSEGRVEIEQLAHIAPEEQAAVDALVDTLAARGTGPKPEELDLLRSDESAADIALFGRMLAAAPSHNVEAAAQVAHAITVHKTAVEDDFFTAVDDLNNGDEDRGAGHMGETEFGAGLYYLYICIDRELLRENLHGNAELANKALGALMEAAATVAPSGKQNSFGSRAWASYILAEKGDWQPRSLSVAFLEPLSGGELLDKAVAGLEANSERMAKVYGMEWASLSMNAHAGTGSLRELIDFVAG